MGKGGKRALAKEKEKAAKLAKRKGARTLAKKAQEKVAKLKQKLASTSLYKAAMLKAAASLKALKLKLKNAKRPKIVKKVVKKGGKKAKEKAAKLAQKLQVLRKKLARYKKSDNEYKSAMVKATLKAERVGPK